MCVLRFQVFLPPARVFRDTSGVMRTACAQSAARAGCTVTHNATHLGSPSVCASSPSSAAVPSKTIRVLGHSPVDLRPTAAPLFAALLVRRTASVYTCLEQGAVDHVPSKDAVVLRDCVLFIVYVLALLAQGYC